MDKLLQELKERNMIMNDWHSCFLSGTPIGPGGLLSALSEASRTWYCSLTENCFYYFKIKNWFSYGGIKTDTIKKIRIRDIKKIVWKPKAFAGGFKIEHINGKLTGTVSSEELFYNNFKAILKYFKYTCKIPCEGFFHKPDRDI